MKDQYLMVLRRGVISLEGQFLNSSNYTFLVNVRYGKRQMVAVYKPKEGERPLWDFPEGTLVNREAAAYLVSAALGWDLVPETVLRSDGPFGAGSLQRYVEHDPEYYYFNFRPADQRRLKPVAAFDALINNADRKGGHILIDEHDHLWLIDHGICFHEEDKLRTVVWDFAGEEVPAQILNDIRRFASELERQEELFRRLRRHLTVGEIDALLSRARALVAKGRFPMPSDTRRPYPWPPV